MCSFLLLFLIVIVGFDFLQNSIAEFHPETAFAPSESTCTAYVASALQAGSCSQPVGAFASPQDFCGTSFKGPHLSEEDTFRNQETEQNHGSRSFSVALHSLPAHQQKSRRILCGVPRLTGRRECATALRPEHNRRRPTEIHGYRQTNNTPGKTTGRLGKYNQADLKVDQRAHASIRPHKAQGGARAKAKGRGSTSTKMPA